MRIEWSEHTSSHTGSRIGISGKLEGIVIFRISHLHERYNLRTDLPGYAGKIWSRPSEEEAKELAGKILIYWMSRVGMRPIR